MSQKIPGGGSAENTVTPFRDVNADSAQRKIADDLRQARLARGVEIADVAQTLRIRAVYLVALEEGRFAELPGPTYVAGFLRAYGGYLDLDGEELVRRYKDESGGVIARQALNFPVPASEARHPTGLIIAGALVLAVAAAATWYMIQERGSVAVELVSAVPEELASIAVAATAGTGDEEAPAGAEEAGADPASLDTAPPAEGEDGIPAPEEAEIVSGAMDIGDGSGDAGAEMVDEAASATLSAGESDAGETGGDDPGLGGTVAEGAELADASGYVPRVYGRTNAGSRVEIRATSETWIQVEGDSGEILITRVLLPGDVYLVPDHDNVTLDTGNAGGIEIRVDGVLVAPLGEPGIVLRNVSLAPDGLLAR